MNKVIDTHLLDALVKIPLFKDIDAKPAQAMLACFNSEIVSYQANDVIIHTGSKITKIGIVLSGYVSISKLDLYGHRNIITYLNVGEIFSEVFLSAGLDISPVTVTSGNTTTIMFIDYHRIIRNCSHICQSHTQLIQNILSMMSKRNIHLTEKLEIIGKRSIREKLKAYLTNILEKTARDNHTVSIDLSRQELADYLCVDRSALSREISNMQQQGIITVDKKKIIINKIESF